MTDETWVEGATTIGCATEASLEELLTFERLLADLSARFADVSVDQVEAEIDERANATPRVSRLRSQQPLRIHCRRAGHDLMLGFQRRSGTIPARPSASFSELVSRLSFVRAK